MKRNRFFFFLFFCLVFRLYAQEIYYRSDWVGLELEKIERYRIDEFEYVLEVRALQGKTVKLLYRNGKEWKRWEILFNLRREKTDEFEYEKNVLVHHLAFDKKMRILVEDFYLDGVIDQKRIYSYGPRGIDFAETQDREGNLLYTDEYIIAPSGRLRGIRRIFPDGGVILIHYTYGEGMLVGEWEYRDGRIKDTKYDEYGRIIRREDWNKDELEFVKEYRYDDNNGKILSETEKDLKRKTVVERFYDEDGNIIRETNSGAVEEPFELTHTFDGGRKVATRKKSALGVEEWRYTYRGDGSLAVEEYYRRGLLEMRTTYGDGNSRIEEIFREEELFLRVYYVKEKKIKEEYLEDGRVVRTREY